MKSHSITSKFENYQIPIQIIAMKDSFFVYIGTAELNFENLIVSLCHNEVSELFIFSLLIPIRFMRMSILRLGRAWRISWLLGLNVRFM
jgi:hypothetical protein